MERLRPPCRHSRSHNLLALLVSVAVVFVFVVVVVVVVKLQLRYPNCITARLLLRAPVALTAWRSVVFVYLELMS